MLTEVAIALAVSWKPLIKSKMSARVMTVKIRYWSSSKLITPDDKLFMGRSNSFFNLKFLPKEYFTFCT